MTYQDEQNIKNIKLLREMKDDLPSFLDEYFIGISQRTSSRTRLAYAYDLKIFFHYLIENNKNFKNKKISDITIEDLNIIQTEDIELFLDYLSLYQTCETHVKTNETKGKARKLAAIRSMFKYFLKKKKISTNPAAIVDTPKIHDKAIVRLDANELANLLDEVESGDKLSKHQQKLHDKFKLRDLAIITLLAGTGIRVSECVGINTKDINFDRNSVIVSRKGGNQAVLYFGDEVKAALLDYITEKNNSQNTPEDKDALFISNRGTRITTRQVQNLVKKYASVAVAQKKISPHKLRSTYGTNLYQETGDIYLVADVLGHADVNTTKKHYAAIEESRRMNAAKYIKLRKD